MNLFIFLLSLLPGEPDSDPERDIKTPPPTSSAWAKAQYYIPSLYWIPNYSLSLYENSRPIPILCLTIFAIVSQQIRW